jgi:sporulation integral membrane protein YlbJ
MKNLRKNVLFTLLFGILLFFILSFSHMAKQFAYLGLSVWFEQIIPSLLPFMIISSILVQLNLDELLIMPVKPIIRFLYRISDAGIYVMIMGFLCGFPMGAKAAVMEYENGKISREEADFLLAFTNNIGPVYFLSFVYGQIYQDVPLCAALLVLYGIPLLYGWLLRNTRYRSLPSALPKHAKTQPYQTSANKNFLIVLDNSIRQGLTQIAMLGGYMILCNLLVLIPTILFPSMPLLRTLLHNLLEISGGLTAIKSQNLPNLQAFVCAHISLAFTGISCHLQTFHIIGDSGLSKQKYMLHKLLLCSIVGVTLYLCTCFQAGIK